MSALYGSDASLGFATGSVLGGLVFSRGLLVVVAGAELFTDNNLLAGSVLVGLTYPVIYRRNAPPQGTPTAATPGTPPPP